MRATLRIEWVVVGALLFVLAPPVHAYLDPGTGSMIVAAIVAIFATIAMAVKTYWYKIVSLFRGKGRKRQS